MRLSDRFKPIKPVFKCVAMADTHGLHHRVQVPDGDLFIHAGDFSNFGIDSNELIDFVNWVALLPHKHKIVVAGNHDRVCYVEPGFSERTFNKAGIHYLESKPIEIEGFRIWGSPITPTFGNWSFMKSDSEIAETWKLIPDNIDILITHGPPFNILDLTIEGVHTGCPHLANTILHRVRPKFHVFGHVHEGFGKMSYDQTTFLNVSVLNRKYVLSNPCTIFEL
jgi:Icc-related predicted phosphoesterase